MSTLPRISARRRGRRLLAAAGAVLALAASYLVVTTLTANAAGTLLSQGKPATASSTENAGTPASAAVDGNTGTRWSSAFSDPQWIQVDLGATATLSQVVLQWEAAYATAYQIQVSADATNWTNVYSTTTGTGGTQTLNITGTGRYVRVYGTARATQWGYSLWEFQVYGTIGGGGCGTDNAALNKAATASSTENAGTPASSAVDGNAGTRWSSAFSDPQWLQIDFGTAITVCQVVLTWETAYATAFQIQLSNDASSWSTIYSTTTGTGGTQTLNVSGTGRYLRLYATARATQYGDSLWEVVVHSGSGATSSPSASPTPTPTNTGGDVELSYNKPATASSYQDDAQCVSCLPARVTDQFLTTRWATNATTGWVDPGWIYIDLGATATIHSVMLQWDPAYASAYQIQVSANASSWTTIYSTTTSTGFKQTLTGLNGTGRYVRMYGTARGTPYGYSLWEFQVFGTGGSPTPPPPLPPNVTFPATHLVFDDEFNGAAGSTPDPAKWFADTGSGQNNELEYYTNNANAKMDGAGNLVIQARKETTAGSSCPGGPCQYTSGRINTSKSFTFTYGHVEARIKVSGTQGLWPAFWLLGANFDVAGWPGCGEIDIMEHVGSVPNAVYSTIHAPAYFGAGGLGSPDTISGDFASDFHTYAVDWNFSHMTFYVDGNPFFTLNKTDVEAQHGPWVYDDHPFYIILNNAVGGDWPGSPDGTSVFPANMSIDYVRVYQN
ncbi:MAG TPA: discoidin domain-containing protein [Rugosimonospora sp.]|nr:discoidin domain-containing protein [Rugosimonospora sp.]